MADNRAVLFECTELQPLLRRWIGRSLPRRVVAHWLAQGAAPRDPQPRWFIDDPEAPAIFVRLHHASCTVHGESEAVARALLDLCNGRMRSTRAWPDATTQAAWTQAGRRELHLSRVTAATLASARAAGFRDVPEATQPHYCAHAWHVRGRPRFAERVRHACRIVEGDELLELFLEDNARDEAGYIHACLQSGPSFVCEAGGRPVSWSLTHLGGAIGRIYTPPEHRGQGYAGSMIALQVDTLLARQGIAAASVRVDNAGSYRIFMGLEARHLRGPLTWSTLLWPE